MYKVFGLHEHTCALCGTKFECRTEHAYKRYNNKKDTKYDYYCSYSCMREAKKEGKNHAVQR